MGETVPTPQTALILRRIEILRDHLRADLAVLNAIVETGHCPICDGRVFHDHDCPLAARIKALEELLDG